MNFFKKLFTRKENKTSETKKQNTSIELESFCENSKYGFKDRQNGEVIIPAKYDAVDIFHEGLARVMSDKKSGFVDKNGKEIVPLKYDYVIFFSEGLASFKLNGKYGFINKAGKEVVPAKYDGIESFSEGLALVALDRKYGFIDKTGKEVIPLKYDEVGSLNLALDREKHNEKFGVINSFSTGIAKVRINNKWLYIDKQGNEYATEEDARNAISQNNSDLNSCEIDMVFVKGGTLTRACLGGMIGDNFYVFNPISENDVTLDDFYIGRYEVTQAQWTAIMGNNPSHFKGKKLPVENVSWNDIQIFIQKLNKQTGKNYRLPTEAEWEYAARGGIKGKPYDYSSGGTKGDGYNYSGSNNLDNVAWYYGNSEMKSHEVGTKKPNELDIYDMSGNVLEWCSDCYKEYYIGPADESKRSCRGGSWANEKKGLHLSMRFNYPPSDRYYYLGFRLVRDVETQ
ncbi:MAG: SUMF1/EgtB/PvdO family nonheme iron enzyme [Prevotellaceae bacterium]|jgi:formylglycine-generating enzyme required for sulfatase activity|nr:SUMF1/EgtB/PvdO family nonheme iron enzyme [Prevotellaceae bacterium]